MNNPGVKDTTAYEIVRQITDHIYGPDTELSDTDFVEIFKSYYDDGGSWEKLIDGDMKCVKIIEEAIDNFINNRTMNKVAVQVASLRYS